MTQSQYARHVSETYRVSVTQQAVSKAVRRGSIPLVEGRIDSDIADQVWALHRGMRLEQQPVPAPAAPAVDAALQPPAPPAPERISGQQQALTFIAPPPGSPADEQAQLVRARREKLEFEMEVKRGDYVPLREVEQAWGEMITAVRNRILLVEASISDPTVRAQLGKALREAFADVSTMPIVNAALEVPAA